MRKEKETMKEQENEADQSPVGCITGCALGCEVG